MDLLRKGQYIMHVFIIILVYWLGWLCGLVLGQVGETFTGAANFPDIGLTCLANLAAFLMVLLRGKRGWEVEDLQGEFRDTSKFGNIRDLTVLTTSRNEVQKCSVVLLSFHESTLLTRVVMNNMSDAYDVHSIFLRCRPLQCGAAEACTENHEGGCRCIIFDTVEDITVMISRQMPGTLKRLSDDLCLLPSVGCLRKGCHGCNQGLWHVENDRLREGGPHLESPAAVCEILDQLESVPKVSACICIPVHSANDDKWTNQLIRLFKPEDNEFRGVVIRKGRTDAFSALENYKNGNGECDAEEKYSLASLIIVPMLTQVLINLVMTFCLKVDGFSSTMLSIHAVKRYLSIPDFVSSPCTVLYRARVKSNANNTNVCQVLFFRNFLPNVIFLALQIFTSLICSISWMVLVALEGGANKWYHTHSMPPSKGRVAVILVGVCIALAMDVFDLNLCLQIKRMPRFRRSNHRKIILKICVSIVLEILCIAACSAIAGVVGIKAFGRWLYSALQCLVWVKFMIGSDLPPLIIQNNSQDSPEYGEPTWWYGTCGQYIISSALLLNATLAGVRAQWEF